LNQIFQNSVEEQVKTVMDSIVRPENLMVVFLYSDLLYRVLVSHNNKQFVHQPLVALLRFAKEKCDEYVTFFKSSISEFKVNKREKIGILKYVAFFEVKLFSCFFLSLNHLILIIWCDKEFVREAEACWEPIKKDLYEKLCIIYQQIVNEIFNGIETVANESQKTPMDVVKFQNYHQMNRNLSFLNLNRQIKINY
jgi:hypothetical protein